MVTLPPDNGDKRQATITADALLLAAQNERIDRLVSSIEQLTAAVGNRPTKTDLEQARKRLRSQVIATVLAGLLLFGMVGFVLVDMYEQCENRNSNTASFRVLLSYLVESSEDDNTNRALQTYLNTLEPVSCL